MDKSITRQYYTINELAEKWQYETSDITHLIETEQLNIEVQLQKIPAVIYEELELPYTRQLKDGQKLPPQHITIKHSEGFISGTFSISPADQQKLIADQMLKLNKAYPSNNGSFISENLIRHLGASSMQREPVNFQPSNIIIPPSLDNRKFLINTLNELSEVEPKLNKYIEELDNQIDYYFKSNPILNQPKAMSRQKAKDKLLKFITDRSENYTFFKQYKIQITDIPQPNSLTFHLLPKNVNLREYFPPDSHFITSQINETGSVFDYSDLLVTNENIRISKPEADRFQQEKIENTPPKELTTKERDNLLKTIGLLTRALIEKYDTEKLGSIDKPNISQIAEILSQHRDSNDIPTAGISVRNLKDKIKKGLSLIE